MLENKLVELPEQFVLIVSYSFPLYLLVNNQVMSWQIYLESHLRTQGCHKIVHREQIKTDNREEAEIREPDCHSNPVVVKKKPLLPFSHLLSSVQYLFRQCDILKLLYCLTHCKSSRECLLE